MYKRKVGIFLLSIVADGCVVVGVQGEYHDAAEAIVANIFGFAGDAALVLVRYPFLGRRNVRRAGLLVVHFAHEKVVSYEPANVRIRDET